MQNEFNYLLDTIAGSAFQSDPFTHLEIKNFFSAGDLELLTQDPQISLPVQTSTEDLITNLTQNGYQPNASPGTTDDIDLYLRCLKTNQWPVDPRRVERLGMVFRLQSIRHEKIKRLMEFLNGDNFLSSLLDKFQISTQNVDRRFSIQKYLDGYEISPHPDNRVKKLTFLININTDPVADDLNIHTHLLEFRPEKRFIAEFWKYNPQYNRDLLPWEWTETKKIVNTNNTLLVFSPTDVTLHAAKLDYNHLKFQRTQIYGNVFDSDISYAPLSEGSQKKRLPYVTYNQFDIQPNFQSLDYWYPMDTRLESHPDLKIFKTI
jgi:hypothetical protein